MGQPSTIKTVARDALIIFLALKVSDALALTVLNAGGIASEPAHLLRARIALVASKILFGIVGFCVSGYLSPRRRWVHLVRVTACVWLLDLALQLPAANITGHGFLIRAWVFQGVYLLVAMGTGGAISFAWRRDPGDTSVRTDSSPSSTRTPRVGTPTGSAVNWAKVAAVLSSNLFLLGSCTAITWVSLPVMKHIGGNYMARGEAPSPEMMVIASIPDPAGAGRSKLEAVTLRGLLKFQSTQPDHTFVIPEGSGHYDRNGTSITYRATALSASEIRVETDARYDDPFGSDVVGSYDATEREVRPIYTNRTIGLFAAFFGLAGASVLGLIGSILKRRNRLPAAKVINTG